jgi:hypothetical protein
MRERFGRGARWILLCEDQADECNRVELSTTMTDASGVPAPKISYRLSDNSREIIAWNVARATESLQEAGAWETDPTPFNGHPHLMGTARMGNDPQSSVVDRWGMAHDVPNLGILDGSVFVTAGAVNPTATISALALRAVEHLIDERRVLPVPEHPSTFAVGVTLFPSRGAVSATIPKFSNPAPTSIPFSSAERDQLRRIANALLPEAEGMPAAGAVGAADELLDWVLEVRPDLAPGLRRGLEADDISPEDLLATLAVTDQAACEALILVVVGGYYHHPDVRQRIGYPGQVPTPVSGYAYPEYIAEGLLDHVLSSS